MHSTKIQTRLAMSPRLTINTSEAQGFAPVEPGPYLMTIDKISEPHKSKSEKETIGIDIDFAFADPNLQLGHGHVRKFYPIQGKGAGFFADLYRVVTGNELPIGPAGGDLDIDTDELLGQTVQVDVGNQKSQKEGDDRIFNTVRSVVAAD